MKERRANTSEYMEHNRTELIQAIKREKIFKECCKIKYRNAEDTRENISIK